ncbi:urea amidolyase family protein [Microbacterium sp. NPDC096154]|uniref:5-oxoprolinase subunit B/C family protein n=1 Tax=Microbacterium sp. NPDC096154 TaxID=3155549 RepID=UPI003320DE11
MTAPRRILPVSDRALLVEEADLAGAMRLHAALSEADVPGVHELVPAARTVLVRFDPLRVTAGRLREILETLPAPDVPAGHGPTIAIAVRYDGEDLADVAAALGVSVDELVARHSGASWRVAFTGFAPGFGYLVGDDPLFDVPRRASPRTRIPAGSVALAGPYSGVYPRESPGGWQLIGRTDVPMWDLRREPPALLAPGTRVRFEAVERPMPTGRMVPAPTPSRARMPVVGPHAVEVVSPGAQLTVQDGGRSGHARWGVSRSGAADRRALRAANEAVGNPPHAAALELAGGGAVLRFRGPGVVAVSGAAMDPVLVHPDGDVLPLSHAAPAPVQTGDELHLGPARAGLRATIAIRGGLALTPVLGSLSSDTLADIGAREVGGATLAAGCVLPLRGPSAVRTAVEPAPPPPPSLPAPGDVVVLRIVLGPRDDWFTPSARESLVGREWTVTPRSDRVGMRLEGDTPLARAVVGELPSEATVAGALQVPPDGQPVLFLADHPLTGGYPVIAAVVDADLDLAGQLPAGARIRFRMLTGRVTG